MEELIPLVANQWHMRYGGLVHSTCHFHASLVPNPFGNLGRASTLRNAALEEFIELPFPCTSNQSGEEVGVAATLETSEMEAGA